MFEDFFIVVVIISVIYGVYSFISPDKETIKKEVNIPQEFNTTSSEKIIKLIEKNITQEINTIEDQNITQEINTTEDQNITQEINTTMYEIKEETITKEINNTIEVEQNTPIILEETLTIKEFQNNLLKDIKVSAESRRVQHNFFKNNRGFVRARFTISNEGILDNLEYIKGDEYYLKYIKNEIHSVFPVQIPKNLFDEFPQSFELRIEY